MFARILFLIQTNKPLTYCAVCAKMNTSKEKKAVQKRLAKMSNTSELLVQVTEEKIKNELKYKILLLIKEGATIEDIEKYLKEL